MVNTETQIRQTRMNAPRRFGLRVVGQIAALGLAALIGYGLHTPKIAQEPKAEALTTVNQIEYNQGAVSNFCNDLIASRDAVAKRTPTIRMGFDQYRDIDANKAYVAKLTEIIASLKGDNYSPGAYTAARAEFHNAVEAYTK